jgi:hypothetical protein
MKTKQLTNLRELAIKWINSEKRDFNQGLKLMKKANYKPHVIEHIENWGISDNRAQRALNMEMRNYLRESRISAKRQDSGQKPSQDLSNTKDEFVGNLEKELQQEYPGIIKRVLTEFHSLYQQRSILHKELKSIGEKNDEKSVNERKGKLNIIDVCSLRMDTLWGIFEKYKTDGDLPEGSFFDNVLDLEKAVMTGRQIPGYKDFVIPDNMDELKKLKENLRIKISKAKFRLEYQSEKKEEKSNPMPDGPKRADLVKRIEEMEKQKEQIEYKIVELK